MIALAVWMLLASVGLMVQTLSLWECRMDRLYADAMHWNGALRLTIDSHRRNNLVRLYVVSTNLALGLLAIFVPLALAVALPVGLILNEVLLIGNAFVDRAMRHKLAEESGHKLLGSKSVD